MLVAKKKTIYKDDYVESSRYDAAILQAATDIGKDLLISINDQGYHTILWFWYNDQYADNDIY